MPAKAESPQSKENAGRLLCYAWSPYDRKPDIGSGISIFCRDLVEVLLRQGFDVTFLYSGHDYSALPTQPRVEKVTNEIHPQVTTYSLVNSTLASPAFLDFGRPGAQQGDPPVDDCFASFLKDTGPYHTILFQALEGLSAKALAIAKASGARVFFTAHNYYPMCPQVNLIQGSGTLCSDYAQGNRCVACQSDRTRVRLAVVLLKRFNAGLRRLGLSRWNSAQVVVAAMRAFALIVENVPALANQVSRAVFPSGAQAKARDAGDLAARYRRRREAMISQLNESIDGVLCYSEHVRQTYCTMGVHREKLVKAPVGPARLVSPMVREIPFAQGPFRLVYLGKVVHDKGFFFFCENLLKMPRELLQRIDLLVAGRPFPSPTWKKWMQLTADAVGKFRHITAYDHAQLPELLKDRHLGVVPSLFAETCSFVTLEQLLLRLPVLVSNRGAMKEFVKHPHFVFDPNIPEDFVDKFREILETPSLLSDFWSYAVPIPTMEDHVAAFRESDQAVSPRRQGVIAR